MQKCAWPTCYREQNAEYCFMHGRGNTVKSKSKPQQQLSIPELIDKAQKVFNAWIRDRDRAFGCITCGSSVTEAGHFIPVGENSALRFEENNCWGQCHSCNTFKGGNLKIYRIVLIEKVGLDEVLRLETTPNYNKWSRQQLENIIEQYSTLKLTS